MENKDLFEKSEIAKLPTEFGDFNIIIYKNTITGVETGVIFKKITLNNPIVRLHSECFTGDIFHSLKCDCKQQLHIALQKIENNGHGFLIYLKGHEGRGIGLFNKINAYKLQEEGLNTLEANKRLNFSTDLRTYDDAVMIIKDLKLDNFILLTENPYKTKNLEQHHLKFTVEKIDIIGNPHNIKYITDKKQL